MDKKLTQLSKSIKCKPDDEESILRYANHLKLSLLRCINKDALSNLSQNLNVPREDIDLVYKYYCTRHEQGLIADAAKNGLPSPPLPKTLNRTLDRTMMLHNIRHILKGLQYSKLQARTDFVCEFVGKKVDFQSINDSDLFRLYEYLMALKRYPLDKYIAK